MSTETNIAVVRRFWQGFNAHNLAVWDEVCTPDFINHDAGLPTPDADLPTIKQTIQQVLFSAFPDLQTLEQDLVAEENKVVVRQTMSGTHMGDFMGIAPTGQTITFSGMWLAHLTNGKLKEQWVFFDALGLLQQVGAIPLLG